MFSDSPTLFRCILFALLAFMAVSCASRTAGERRLEKYPELSSGLKDREKTLIASGEITEGMSKDAVFLAWGRPDRIRSGSKGGKKSESWAYFGTTPITAPGVSYGYGGSRAFYSRFGVHPTFGYGSGAGWNYGTSIDFASHVEREVRFVNDRVVSWERTR